MCEFKVFLDGEKVFEEVIYVETTAGGVVLRDILGDEKKLEQCFLEKVDVASETLLLSSTSTRIKKGTNR